MAPQDHHRHQSPTKLPPPRLLGKISPQKHSVKESGETAVNRLGIPPRNVTTQSDSKEEHKLTKVQELLLKQQKCEYKGSQ